MKLDLMLNVEVNPDIVSLLQTAADTALRVEGVSLPCVASVCLCDRREIHELNLRHRGIDSETDVLSFPSINWPEGKTAGSAEFRLSGAYDPDWRSCFLGDIVISVPKIYEQAAEYGHSPEREAAYLLVHGLCHLMGYDHMEESEKTIMRSKEEEIMNQLGISRDTVGFSVDEMLLNAARKAMENSYSPYSHFPVGAALLSKDGRIFTGCNIENASFGVTCCAERTALFKAVSEGVREFEAVAIACRDDKPAWPCGICRQALSEFAPSLRVLVTWNNGMTDESTLDRILPYQFALNRQEKDSL